MVVTELMLWAARLLVLVLMYLFLLALVLALLADARAAKSAARPPAAPVPPHPVTPSVPAPEPTAASAPVPSAPAESSPAPELLHLELQSGTTPVTGRRYALYTPLEIGRGTGCDISIPNRYVSTRHARIFPHEGRWLLEDLGSTNGTLVNGAAVSAPHSLAPGDRVQVGDTEFLVQ